MSAMVENVAKAMMDQDLGHGTYDRCIREGRWLPEVEIWRWRASAAIAAMRKPTPEMVTAWQSVKGIEGLYYGEVFRRHWWPAAIDAALPSSSQVKE